MVTVYHNSDFLNFSFMNEAQVRSAWENIKQRNLTKVAEVTTESLDEAYQLTNNIDRSWVLNRKVRSFKSEARSTSIGDLMKFKGNSYVVATTGFIKL